jgi:hypothetical protein
MKITSLNIERNPIGVSRYTAGSNCKAITLIGQVYQVEANDGTAQLFPVSGCVAQLDSATETKRGPGRPRKED